MRYLSTKEIIKINAKVILRHSPGEMIGVKDANALDMAVKQPSQAVFNQELYPEIYEKAAILAINLAKKHPLDQHVIKEYADFFMFNHTK